MGLGVNFEDVAAPAPQPSQAEDPLIAALPPETDYITYLTILEYQLNPDNLSVLNRLLKQDDGTLAAEIGWDLLRLVLPMLTVNAQAVKECLGIISKRGNPREVIVRVAEELENLGQHEVDDGHNHSSDIDNDLPTFAGEAPRVHLGSMILDGMPEVTKHVEQPQQEVTLEARDTDTHENSFQALLSMLAPLHARIKTKFPSRFLATSLPAALGAYRRSTMDTQTTISFLQTLKELNPQSKPDLPPRIPQTDGVSLSPISLPDPESKAKDAQPDAALVSEAAITSRLLHAVLLEIIDEYVSANTSLETTTAVLATQVRINCAPWTVPSHRQAEIAGILNTQIYQSVLELYQTFLETAVTLGIMLPAEGQAVINTTPDVEEVESEHEYPTTPSQIPLSHTGLLLLSSIQQYLASIADATPPAIPLVSTGGILALVQVTAAEDATFFSSPVSTDLVLSLLFVHFIGRGFTAYRPLMPEVVIQQILSILQQVFTTNPDPSVRDNAHYLATHLFHSRTTRATKIDTINAILRDTSSSPLSERISPFELHQAINLRVVAINWLKDELFPSQLTKAIMQTSPSPDQAGLPISAIHDLIDYLFPDTQSSSDRDKTTPEDIVICTARIPLYIATINLFCLLVQSAGPTSSDNGTATNSLPALFSSRIAAFLALPRKYRPVLLDKAQTSAEGDDALDATGLGLEVGDIFALDDALNRVQKVTDQVGQSA